MSADASNEDKPTYLSLVRSVRERLRDGGVPDSDASAEWLITEALECTRTELYSRSGDSVTPDQIDLLEQWVIRRLSREPVQYIVGYTEFCGLRLRVNPAVLIPRPETELLVEAVAKTVTGARSPIRILDIGTFVARTLPGLRVW